jgi:peptide-methionine (R)-S-oxide reductase
MNRRLSMAGLVKAALGLTLLPATQVAQAVVSLTKSKTDWKKLLPAPNYAVLFNESTERPGSSALDHEKRAGTYVCFACHLPLFASNFKYDSGTGWPSFFDVMPDAIGKHRDYLMILPRTEYHCARCGGHQGHVFGDGPKPTGLRYCNNGVALQFIPAGQKLPELIT